MGTARVKALGALKKFDFHRFQARARHFSNHTNTRSRVSPCGECILESSKYNSASKLVWDHHSVACQIIIIKTINFIV